MALNIVLFLLAVIFFIWAVNGVVERDSFGKSHSQVITASIFGIAVPVIGFICVLYVLVIRCLFALAR